MAATRPNHSQHTAATNRHRRSARIVNGPPVSYAQDKPYRKPYKPAEIWHEALRVHNQRTFRGQQQFHVEWAGIDPSTGGAYPFSWLNARKLSEHLRRSWEDHKARKAEADVLRLEPVPTPEQQLRLRELEDASAKYFSAPNADDDASSSSGAESPLNEEAAHHDDDDGGCSICEDPEQAEDGVLISPCCASGRTSLAPSVAPAIIHEHLCSKAANGTKKSATPVSANNPLATESPDPSKTSCGRLGGSTLRRKARR